MLVYTNADVVRKSALLEPGRQELGGPELQTWLLR